MKIIGITGTLGAGKGTIVQYLLEKKGFTHFSVRSYLIKELTRLNIEINRDSMMKLANELRTQNNPAFIIEELYRLAIDGGKNSVIESIRTAGEVMLLRSKGNFKLFAVDASPEIRYQRILLRNSETDKVNFETFRENELREMDSADPNHQNLKKCIEMADAVFLNNGTVDQLFSQIEKELSA